MKLAPIKCEAVTGASRGVYLSHSYIVCCRGTSVFVLERETLRLLKKVTGVDHIKNASVSPDEKWVLITATNDAFYILSLADFSIARYSISDGSVNCGNTVKGCWSFDGKAVFVTVDYSHSDSVFSSLRRYSFNGRLDERLNHTDLIKDRFYFRALTAVPEIKRYLLLGDDRSKDRGSDTLIVSDGESFEEYPIFGVDGNAGMSGIVYDTQTHRIMLSGILGISEVFEAKDGAIRRLSALESAVPNESDTYNAVLAAAGCDAVEVNDVIRSANGELYYVSAKNGLTAVSANAYAVSAPVRIRNGVLKTVEFGDRYLGVATLDGVRVYELIR